MPKWKKVFHTPAPLPPARPIKSFVQPAPFKPPASTPPKASNELAAEAVRIASSPGGIDPRQMR